MPDPVQTQTALVRVVDADGMCYATLAGATATKTDKGLSFSKSSLKDILASMRPGRSIEITMRDDKGKKSNWIGTPVVVEGDDDHLTLDLKAVSK